MISFKTLFEKVAVPDPNIFLWVAASVVDPDAVNSYGIKTLLANGFSTVPTKDKSFLVMVLKVCLKILLIVLF